MRFAVASKAAALGFGKRDVQLLLFLAPVSVFERTWVLLKGLEDSAVPRLSQRSNMVIEVIKIHTFLPSGMLLAGGEGGAWIRLDLDKDCL